jgi:hypothetical protein
MIGAIKRTLTQQVLNRSTKCGLYTRQCNILLAEHAQSKFHSSYRPYNVKKKEDNPQNIDFTGEAKKWLSITHAVSFER